MKLHEPKHRRSSASRLALVGLLLGACDSADNDDKMDGGATDSTRTDVADGRHASFAELADSCKATCSDWPVCVATGVAPDLIFAEQNLPTFCTCQLLPAEPSASLAAVCVVSSSGELMLTLLGGSVAIKSSGFTHSGYGGGNIPSTLSAGDEARCDAARQALGQVQGELPPACSRSALR